MLRGYQIEEQWRAAQSPFRRVLERQHLRVYCSVRYCFFTLEDSLTIQKPETGNPAFPQIGLSRPLKCYRAVLHPHPHLPLQRLSGNRSCRDEKLK